MAASWKVTRQAPDQVDITTSNDPVTGTRIFIVTGNGQAGSVFIPDTVYHNTAAVKEALQTEANQRDVIAGLHG